MGTWNSKPACQSWSVATGIGGTWQGDETLSIPRALRSHKVSRDSGYVTPSASRPLPTPRPVPGPASLGLKNAPGNVTFFLRRCDGRRWPRQFSCRPIQRLGTVTVPLNPEAGFLPPTQAGQNSSPFPASRALPSARGPGAPVPACLPPGPCLLLHVYSVRPSRTGHCPRCGHSPICQMGQGCAQTSWSSSFTP